MALPTPRGFSLRKPDDDTHERAVCDTCGFVAYENPKVVVGTVVRRGDEVLLCRRAIEPRRGFWTLPAGYMELGETVEDAARREAREEAMADIALSGLLAVYSVPRIGQVQVMFRGHLASGSVAPGPESLEVGWYDWTGIPWGEIAFPTVRWALVQERRLFLGQAVAPFGNPGTDDPDLMG
jgi:ADP-ribose pyrophosphatase YjhB (NUDIX family)